MSNSLLIRRSQMFTKPDPFIDGNKIYFYKEGLGLNPTYFTSKTANWVEGASHSYIGCTGSVQLINFSIPQTMRLTRVYLDAQVFKPQSNYNFYAKNSNTLNIIIVGGLADTWNNGTTDRIEKSSTTNILTNQNWTLTIQSHWSQARVFNFYATFTSL